MTDLVTRIRNRIHDAPLETERMLDEAADEIEQLRDHVERFRNLISSQCRPTNIWPEGMKHAWDRGCR